MYTHKRVTTPVKKKKHTVKTQYMIYSEFVILHKTDNDRGRIHDYENIG